MKITLEIKMSEELSAEELAMWVRDCANRKVEPQQRLAQLIRSTLGEGKEEAA